MAETMSDVERVLWRIAELGARCGQHTADGGRGPLWAELEQTIAGLEGQFEAAHQAADTVPAQVRSLEGRLKVAREERDRERARAEEGLADAAAARRERDREHQKARRAMAATILAKDAAAEANAAAAAANAAATEARNTAATYVARATAAEAATDQAMAARDQAVAALDNALFHCEQAVATCEEAVAARDEALRTLDEAEARITHLEAELETARAGRDEAVDTLAARADGVVVVLPGVTLPDGRTGPVAPTRRVSWQPTWSDWADADSDVEVTDTGPTADLTDLEAETEIRVDDSHHAEESGVPRYLYLAATIAQLLPEDLSPLLVRGTTVIRREGRLCATLAVPTGPWSEGSDTEQADRLAEAGYRVEWTSNAPLGV